MRLQSKRNSLGSNFVDLGRLSRVKMWVTLLAFFLALTPLRAVAQAQNTGTIAGNIADAQGNAVANAEVSLTSETQAKTLTIKSNAKGEYLFTDVAVGTYTLRVTAPSFQAYTVNSVAVDADQNIRLDARLSIGAVSDSVTVEAAGNTIDTRSG